MKAGLPQKPPCQSGRLLPGAFVLLAAGCAFVAPLLFAADGQTGRRDSRHIEVDRSRQTP